MHASINTQCVDGPWKEETFTVVVVRNYYTLKWFWVPFQQAGNVTEKWGDWREESGEEEICFLLEEVKLDSADMMILEEDSAAGWVHDDLPKHLWPEE